MSRNGSGQYIPPASSWNPAVDGNSATTADFNALLTDLSNALTQSVSKDGQTAMTGNLPMGGNKLSGLGAGSVAGDSIRFEQLFSQGTESDLASAATVDIGGQLTNFIRITGATTISSFGTNYNGPKFLRFAGALQLTHNATTLILPGAANITTQAGDCALIKPVGNPATGWQVVAYQKISGAPIGAAAPGANSDITSLSALTSIPNGTVSNLPSVVGSFSNLRASATGLSANVSVSADEIVLSNPSNQYVTLRSVSLTIAGTTTGANALDTGTLASSTWYSVWVIWNGTTTAGLLSLSSTSPTMPSGYTYKARIGWIRTDATANKFPLSFTQFGRRVRYKVASGSNVTGYPLLATGVQGSTSIPTWVSVAVANFVPTTASSIHGTMFNNGGINGNLMIAPNNSHGALNSNTNPPYATINASSDFGQRNFEMLLEGANIFVAGNSGSNWMCQGWEDKL